MVDLDARTPVGEGRATIGQGARELQVLEHRQFGVARSRVEVARDDGGDAALTQPCDDRGDRLRLRQARVALAVDVRQVGDDHPEQ